MINDTRGKYNVIIIILIIKNTYIYTQHISLTVTRNLQNYKKYKCKFSHQYTHDTHALADSKQAGELHMYLAHFPGRRKV